MHTATEPLPVDDATPCGDVTEVVVSAGAGGHPRLVLRSGLLTPRLLGTSLGVARVALVASTAMLLAGDVMRLRVEVGKGMHLDLQDVAATVAYNGRGGTARWDVSITVGQDATFVWHGEPLVVAHGADVVRTLRVDVATGGRLLLRDIIVLGRHGERGGSLRCETRTSYAGRPLIVEQLDLVDHGSGLRFGPGVVGDHRVVETLTWVGDPVPPTDGWEQGNVVRMDLAGPGLVARHLGSATHASPLEPGWVRLTREIAIPTR